MIASLADFLITHRFLIAGGFLVSVAVVITFCAWLTDAKARVEATRAAVVAQGDADFAHTTETPIFARLAIETHRDALDAEVLR